MEPVAPQTVVATRAAWMSRRPPRYRRSRGPGGGVAAGGGGAPGAGGREPRRGATHRRPDLDALASGGQVERVFLFLVNDYFGLRPCWAWSGLDVLLLLDIVETASFFVYSRQDQIQRLGFGYVSISPHLRRVASMARMVPLKQVSKSIWFRQLRLE